jgi:hypothetical protein
MPTLQPVVTTQDEIQDAACFVDGAGVAFVAYALTSGRGIKVYRVAADGVTALPDATPPPNSGAYSVSLQASGADLIVVATGHVFVGKPRPNPVWQARYGGVVTPRAADPYHAAGAFTGAAVPPPGVPPAPGPSAAEIADAVRARFLTDLGADTLRHGFGGLIQSATTAALQAAYQGGGLLYQSAGLYNRLKETVYEVLKGNGLIK